MASHDITGIIHRAPATAASYGSPHSAACTVAAMHGRTLNLTATLESSFHILD
jgi:hypothetical protein